MENTNTLHVLTLLIGHNVGETPTHTTESIRDACVDVLKIDGGAFSECVGIWQGMYEDSTKCEIFADATECARIIERIPMLCAALKQDAIATTLDGKNPRYIERY